MLVETEPPTSGQKVEKEKAPWKGVETLHTAGEDPCAFSPERVLHFGFGTHDGPSLLMAKGIVSLLERLC